MNDLISRTWLVECLEERWIKFDTEKDYNRMIHLVRDTAPPVQPERKKGEWVLLDDCSNAGYYCSNCQKKVVREGWSKTVKKIKYCPNCGFRMGSMRGEQDDTD